MTVQTSPPQSSPHPIDRLYRFAAGDRVLIFVLVLTALALALSALLPQAPPETAQQSMARWLAETASRYGDLGGALQAAGLFDLWQSPWLWALLGLLAFILLLRLGLAAGDAWQRLRQPDPAAVAQQALHWPLHAAVTLENSAETVAAEMAEDLRSEGWRVASAVSGGAAQVVAERSPWGVLAAPLFTLGLLTALAGLWLGQQAGWREAGVVLAPCQPVRLSQDNSLVLSQPPVPVGDPVAGLLVQRDGQPAIEKTFSILGTARAAGVALHRTSVGQALSVSARDAAGGVLQLQPVDRLGPPQQLLTLVFDQPQAEQLFLAPANELVFSVVAFPALPERGFSGPTFLVQAFSAGQQAPIANQFIEGNADLAIGDAVYSLAAGQFVTVEVSRNPGLPLIITGGALVLAATLMALWRPAGRLSLTIQRQRHDAEVAARLHASPLWRQAPQWLAAWTTTYSREE
ncbi:MAG TPA: cytochrome c biogenesis protein ResB [Anaerolineae bacterium]|nr:cytochrome c biogenesis protein ResB [Anaerolineae bacterium]